MGPSLFVERIQNLSDLELAMLLCLIAKQHCIIETTEEQIDDVAEELALVTLPRQLISVSWFDILDFFKDFRSFTCCPLMR